MTPADEKMIDDMLLERARITAERGYLAGVQLLYTRSAELLEEAADRVPSRYAIFAEDYRIDAAETRTRAAERPDEERSAINGKDTQQAESGSRLIRISMSFMITIVLALGYLGDW